MNVSVSLSVGLTENLSINTNEESMNMSLIVNPSQGMSVSWV